MVAAHCEDMEIFPPEQMWQGHAVRRSIFESFPSLTKTCRKQLVRDWGDANSPTVPTRLQERLVFDRNKGTVEISLLGSRFHKKAIKPSTSCWSLDSLPQ